MNAEILAKFEEVKRFVDRGEAYQNEANYQFASKCYKNAAITLRAIAKQTKKIETLDLLAKKIEKYDELSAEMMAKQKQTTKKSRITSFGFPDILSQRFSMPTLPKFDQKPITMNQTTQPTRPNTVGTRKETDEAIIAESVSNIKASFEDIVGMKELKKILYEAVIIPQKRPDLFKGIREPPRGILLYGPPGNGKTFITKALAKESGCTFFGLSAGSIVNKFVGQTEKTLRKIFDSARKSSPSIIFIDEIDSILTARTQSDGDATRRLKTEFLVQFDKLEGSRVILIGATNLPNELDLAALRRFNKLVYVGLPDKESRQGIIEKTLKDIKYELSKSSMNKLVNGLEGYSASEVTDVIKEACMMPIREISFNKIETVDASKIRPVQYDDFENVLKHRKPLLSKEDLKKYEGKFK